MCYLYRRLKKVLGSLSKQLAHILFRLILVRLPLQVKAGPKSTRSCFLYCCCDVLSVLHASEHHKANLIKHDLGRLKRFFSGQFEELKHKDVSRNKLLKTVSEEKYH